MRTTRALIVMLVVAVATAACNQRPAESRPDARVGTSGTANAASGSPGGGRTDTCVPVEKRGPNAPDQQPAFPGQTRGCATTSNVAFEVVVLAKGLQHPWAIEPLPGGDLLVTERPGRLRIVSARGEMSDPIAGLPPVAARGQGGLLDVALSPTFEDDQTIYWSYAEPRQGGNATTVARGVLSS